MVIDRSILVTGGDGQLGRALKRSLPNAWVLGRSELDIADPASVSKVVELRPEVIINPAAYTQVDAAEANPEDAKAVNQVGVRHLAEAADKVGAALVQVSTDYVFSGDSADPYKETDPTDPRSVYGSTKLAGEVEAQKCSHHLIVRTSWVFGDGRNFIRSILAAAEQRPFLEVVDDQRGQPTYAPDLAEGLVELIQIEARGTLHLAGGGEPATWADLAEFALKVAGIPTEVRRISTADYFAGRQGPIAARPASSVLDCSAAKSIGVELRDWREAAEEFVLAK